MLERLELENVGPSSYVAVDLAPRMNLITGDNGLGKSFLLDIAWWALTRRWPRDLNPRLTSGYMARPSNARSAKLRFTVKTATGHRRSYESEYAAADEGWPGKPGRPFMPGLVIYAHVDGGFSVWDPARNYWKRKGNVDVQERLPGYVFSSGEVWTGLVSPDKATRICKGLLDDWSDWIREQGENAVRMSDVIHALTVPGEHLEVGPILRLSVDDAQDVPSIKTEYCDALPILHASSAVRRIVALAYMLVWSWSEHIRAAEILRVAKTRQVVLLFDEVEAHLHPRWQRTIVPAVLQAVGGLSDGGANIQILAVTHSPLVLASVEPHFDEERDRLFHFDTDDGQVRLAELPWAMQGDVLNWLVSDVFGLRQGRSVEAEAAIEEAEAFMLGDGNTSLESTAELQTIHDKLLRVLPGHDPFWPRWVVRVEQHEGDG